MVERERRTEAGRRLLEAASELFYRDGITAVGVAAIADAAGVTKKTLYDCFGSKAELVVAYLQDRHTTWWNHLEQRLADSRPPRVLTLYEAYLAHPALDFSRGCGFLNGAAELSADHPGLAVIRHHKAAVHHKIAELVRQDRPETGDPDALAEHLFLVLEGAVAQSAIDGNTGRLQHSKKIAESLLSG